jgi:hypothetical protein
MAGNNASLVRCETPAAHKGGELPILFQAFTDHSKVLCAMLLIPTIPSGDPGYLSADCMMKTCHLFGDIWGGTMRGRCVRVRYGFGGRVDPFDKIYCSIFSMHRDSPAIQSGCPTKMKKPQGAFRAKMSRRPDCGRLRKPPNCKRKNLAVRALAKPAAKTL